jgi:hypothetical protein
VADLTNPILTPWAVERLKKANDLVLAGKVPFRARERCYPSGVPAWVVYTLVQPIHILQTSTHVTMINEGGPEVRRIWLNVPHSASPKPTWYGESVGHYEGGDALVVDTIGQTTKTFVDSYLTPHTEQLHVIERYKLIGKAIDVSIYVEDPSAFTTPNAKQRFRRIDREWEEDICAENMPISCITKWCRCHRLIGQISSAPSGSRSAGSWIVGITARAEVTVGLAARDQAAGF